MSPLNHLLNLTGYTFDTQTAVDCYRDRLAAGGELLDTGTCGNAAGAFSYRAPL